MVDSFLLQCGVSSSRMETEQIITWRDGTGSSGRAINQAVSHFSIKSYTMINFPTSSTSHFVNSHFVNSHFVNIDQMGIDEVGIDKVGIDKVRINPFAVSYHVLSVLSRPTKRPDGQQSPKSLVSQARSDQLQSKLLFLA